MVVPRAGSPLVPTLPPARLYYIDFEMSQQHPLGPGRQGAVELPPSVQEKPHDITHLDPYAWDMYCVGDTLEVITKVGHLP